MKVVALGVKKGHRLRFTAQGADAEQALKAIGDAIPLLVLGGRIMSRRVATITLNPAYDLVGFCPEIERGEVNLVKTTGLHAAGKGINVAKVLKTWELMSPLAASWKKSDGFSNCSASWALPTVSRSYRGCTQSTLS